MLDTVDVDALREAHAQGRPVAIRARTADEVKAASRGRGRNRGRRRPALLDVDLTELTMAEPIVATYSIAACDLAAGQWGVAVQSKFLAVGSVVPWAEPHVGAIATQAFANPATAPTASRCCARDCPSTKS